MCLNILVQTCSTYTIAQDYCTSINLNLMLYYIACCRSQLDCIVWDYPLSDAPTRRRGQNDTRHSNPGGIAHDSQ